MGSTRYIAATLAACLLAGAAHAATGTPIVLADARPTQRFMALDSARSGTAGVRVIKPLRSDSQALRSGFMRIDRTSIGTVRRQSPMIQPVQKTASVEKPVIITRPQQDAVLDLFGDNDEAATAPKLGRTSHAWPLPATVSQRFTSAFGMRKDPFTGRQAFHGGIDIGAAVGTSILASADGIVTGVGNGHGLGNYVSIQHGDGSESTYGHLSAKNVTVGQRVRQGQKVGELGSTGRSTGPHLDYRLRKNGQLVNPMTAMRQPAQMNTNVASNAPASRNTTINGVRIIR